MYPIFAYFQDLSLLWSSLCRLCLLHQCHRTLRLIDCVFNMVLDLLWLDFTKKMYQNIGYGSDPTVFWTACDPHFSLRLLSVAIFFSREEPMLSLPELIYCCSYALKNNFHSLNILLLEKGGDSQNLLCWVRVRKSKYCGKIISTESWLIV